MTLIMRDYCSSASLDIAKNIKPVICLREPLKIVSQIFKGLKSHLFVGNVFLSKS